MSLFDFTGTKSVSIKGNNINKSFNLIDVNNEVIFKLQQLESYHTGVSCKLESCRLTYYLPSLTKSPYPKIEFADNVATKMAKISDIQANYPFINLEVYRIATVTNSEHLMASIPLQNKGIISYADLLKPYLTTGEVKLLGENDKILLKINNNGHTLTEEDYLQIEIDYSVIISGTKKLIDEDKIKYSTGELLQNGLLTYYNGRVFFQENNQTLMLYVKALKDLSANVLQFSSSGITSLNNLINSENKNLITGLMINNCDFLPSSEVDKISQLTNLKNLTLLNTNRNNVNFANIIQALELDYLSLRLSELTQLTADDICIKLDNKGGVLNGILDLSSNNGVSSASLTARNNLIAKGWTVTI